MSMYNECLGSKPLTDVSYCSKVKIHKTKNLHDTTNGVLSLDSIRFFKIQAQANSYSKNTGGSKQ